MTNTKTTKRAFVTSVLSIVVCLTMLIGSTFAWFTDSATTGVNTIQSGNLDMKVSFKNKTQTEWKEVTTNDKLFNDAALWEPGYTEVAYLMVENKGSLAFKYQLTVNVVNEITATSVLGNEIKLSEVLKYDLVPLSTDTTYTTRQDAMAAVEDAKNLATEAVSGSIDAKATAKYYALIVYMPESTDNKANHNGTAPSINLGVSIVATQNTVESDSFNNQYDKNALMPNERFAANDKELADILADLNGVDTVYLGAGTFSAFNIPYKAFNLIGTLDESSNPLTKLYFDELATDWNSDSSWAGYTGIVENITFEAKESIEGNGTFTNSALLLHDTDTDVTFKNCKFVNMGVQSSGNLTFTECVFEGNNTAFKAIAFIDPAGDLTVDNCTFSGYTGSEWGCTINVQEGYNSTVTIKNSEIKNGSKSEIGNLNKIILTDNKINEDFIIYFSATIVEESGNTFGEYGKITKQGL